jgi:hypothetical protein
MPTGIRGTQKSAPILSPEQKKHIERFNALAKTFAQGNLKVRAELLRNAEQVLADQGMTYERLPNEHALRILPGKNSAFGDAVQRLSDDGVEVVYSLEYLAAGKGRVAAAYNLHSKRLLLGHTNIVHGNDDLNWVHETFHQHRDIARHRGTRSLFDGSAHRIINVGTFPMPKPESEVYGRDLLFEELRAYNHHIAFLAARILELTDRTSDEYRQTEDELSYSIGHCAAIARGVEALAEDASNRLRKGKPIRFSNDSRTGLEAYVEHGWNMFSVPLLNTEERNMGKDELREVLVDRFASMQAAAQENSSSMSLAELGLPAARKRPQQMDHLCRNLLEANQRLVRADRRWVSRTNPRASAYEADAP